MLRDQPHNQVIIYNINMQEFNSFFSFLKSILNSPLFIVLISGFGVKLYADNKEKNEKIREQQLKLIEDVSLSLHKLFPALFAEIKEKNKSVQRKEELQKLLKELFEMRFIVFTKSKAYFNNTRFFEQFDYVLWELNSVIELLLEIERNGKVGNKFDDIDIKISTLACDLPKKQRDIVERKPKNDFHDYLYIWADVIWFKARNMLSDLLSDKVRF